MREVGESDDNGICNDDADGDDEDDDEDGIDGCDGVCDGAESDGLLNMTSALIWG